VSRMPPVIEPILHFEEAVSRNSPREVQILRVAPRGNWARLRTADKDDLVLLCGVSRRRAKVA
jgi:hypothetical protein